MYLQRGSAAEKVRRPRDTVVPAEGHGRWKQDTTTAYSASAYTAAASPSSHQVRQEFIRGLMTISYLNVGNEKLQGRKQANTHTQILDRLGNFDKHWLKPRPNRVLNLTITSLFYFEFTKA